LQHGGHMQSYFEPNKEPESKPYNEPDSKCLEEARKWFVYSGKYQNEYNNISLIESINNHKKLSTNEKHQLSMGFWIYYLESQPKETNRNPEEKDTPQEEIAKAALNITGKNQCDPATRLIYLAQFVLFLKDTHSVESVEYQWSLYYFARLLFEVNLIDKPTHAIQKFADIPRLYQEEKKKGSSGLIASAQNKLRKLTIGHDEDRNRQSDFIALVSKLCSILENEKKSFHLENHLEAVLNWLVMETELESTQHTSYSKLYKKMLGKLGCVDNQNKPAHSSDIPDNIKKLRFTQLTHFLSKISDSQWQDAADAINLAPERLKQLRNHYLQDYQDKLDFLKEFKIKPRSLQETAGITAGNSTWKLFKLIAIWSTPTLAQLTYDEFGLKNVTSRIANGIARQAGSYVRPALSWIIQKPVQHASEAAVGGGMITGMQYTLNYIIDSATSEEKETRKPSANPPIRFEDFIHLCLDGARRADNKKKCQLYKAIQLIFPLLHPDIIEIFNQNVAKYYFVPDVDKGKCPFRAEKPTRLEPKVEPIDAITHISLIPSAPPPPAASTPTGDISSETPQLPIAPLSPLRAAGMTKTDNSPPPPYAPADDWVVCDETSDESDLRKMSYSS